MSDKPFTLFYAWQNDAPETAGRYFVRDCAMAALKLLRHQFELDIAPRLDHDTKGVPGTPEIANTIFNKISKADAFLADVTMVAAWENREQQREPLPNANVMVELGYAFAELGSERVILVLNEYYASPEHLPFDLRHRRWPITFHLKPDDPPNIVEAVGNKLIEVLAPALVSIAKNPHPPKTTSVDVRLTALQDTLTSFSGSLSSIDDMARRIAELDQRSQKELTEQGLPSTRAIKERTKLAGEVIKGTFWKMPLKQGMVVLVVIPAQALPAGFDIHTKEGIIWSGLRTLYASGGNPERSAICLATWSIWNEEITSVTEFRSDAVIRAASHQAITMDDSNFDRGSLSSDVLIIPSISYERNILSAIQEWIKLYRAMNISGPWHIALALVNLNKSWLLVRADWRERGRVFEGNAIQAPPVVIPADTQHAQEIARTLRPVFDFIWREHGYPGCLNYDSDGNWIMQ
ncbi:MAG: hypothetical protein NTV49_13075 [Kiritimatiellaeota bacterium]|nr:hypothetical protein [Kiritimatiellota bacterium]